MGQARNPELPPNWAASTLGEIARTTRPRHRPGDYPDLPFIGMEHVEAHTMRLLGTVPASEMRSSAVHFWPGDVLYGRLRPYLNKVYRPDFEGLCSGEFIVFPASTNIDSRYLQYRLNAADFVSFASHLNEGDRPRVDFGQLASFSIEIPALPEQHRIVAAIDVQFTRLDAAVTALEHARAHLKRYRAAVLAAACSGRLVPTEAELACAVGRAFEARSSLPSGASVYLAPSVHSRKRAGRLWGAGVVPSLTDDERSRLPEGWAWTKVRDLGSDLEETVQVGPMSMRSRDFVDSGVPVLNVGCVRWDSFDESKLDFLPLSKAGAFERYRVEPDDVIFTRSGTVGRSAVVRPHQAGWLMTFHLFRVRPSRQRCVSKYLRIAFEGADHIRRQTREASIGTTRAGFNTNLLAGLDIPLPPILEQHHIVAEVERRLSVIDELDAAVAANLKRAARLRQAILRRAFEGKLVPQDPNDEPASALLERIRAERGSPVAPKPRARRKPVPSAAPTLPLFPESGGL